LVVAAILPSTSRFCRTLPEVVSSGRRFYAPSPGAAAAIPRPSGADLVRTAKRLLGLPYIWGGRSEWMLDCSGLVSLLYAVHGMVIPRDAGAPVPDGGGTRVATHDRRPPKGFCPGTSSSTPTAAAGEPSTTWRCTPEADG
jgi:hypothetical protein